MRREETGAGPGVGGGAGRRERSRAAATQGVPPREGGQADGRRLLPWQDAPGGTLGSSRRQVWRTGQEMWGQGGVEDLGGHASARSFKGQRGQRQNLEDSTCSWWDKERLRRDTLAEEGELPGAGTVSVTAAIVAAWQSAWRTVGAE